jgi:DNA-binding MarR family transcriptional regulator
MEHSAASPGSSPDCSPPASGSPPVLDSRAPTEDSGSSAEDPQSPPFRAIGFMLSSLGHAVAATFSSRLAPLELEPREFALLRRIDVQEGSSQQAIGERLGIPPSRMVALVDELEERRLLERRPRPGDRRAHALHLTPAGKRLLAKAGRLAAALEGELTQTLDANERAQLLELLDRVAAELGVPPGVHGSHLTR